MAADLEQTTRRRTWIALIIWLTVIWTATSIPGRMLPEGPPGIDRVVHFALYIPLGFLLVLALAPSSGGCGCGLASMVVALATGAAMAALDEWHQQYIANRTASVGDWHWDLRGMIVGSVVALLIVISRRRREHGRDPRRYR